MHCIVCQKSFNLLVDAQRHMQRQHRKEDLIRAAIKLPKILAASSATSATRATRSRQQQQIEDVNVKEESLDCDEENNNANDHMGSENEKGKKRRSYRLKMEDNYYMPPSTEGTTSKSNSVASDESEEDGKGPKKAKMRKKGGKCVAGRQKMNMEPVFTTPKVEKEPSSETDSCSGNANSEHNCERMFCTYCGSGYRTESMLADHIRHNHMHICTTCDMHFPDARRFKEHTQKHLGKIYVCPYCAGEFGERTLVMQHMQHHLDQGVIDGVLSLEEEYLSERVYMNTMYNMFNAGYAYAVRMQNGGGGGGGIGSLPTEFYQVFLQYAAQDVDRVDHYGYLCRTCGFTLFDRSHYRDHMQIAHSFTAGDIDRLLSI